MDLVTSVIIVSHNTRDFTLQCLQSLEPFQKIQTIIVDTGSSDGTLEALESTSIELIRASVSTGYAAAAHLGVQHAKAENIVVCNADTAFYNGCIERLVSALQAPDVGIVAPRLLNTDGTLQPNWACFPDFASEWKGTLDRSEISNPMSGINVVSWVGGACIALKRSTWDTLNGYNPEIMFYGEDTDLCWRARQAGLKTVFVADAIVTHHGGQSSSSRSPIWLRKQLLLARLRDLRMAHGPVKAIPAQCITITRYIAWLLKGFGTPRAHRH